MAQRARPRAELRPADKYALYQRAVQQPEHEVAFCDRTFRRAFARPALRLREDFCGTAAVCCAWARSRSDRRAWGVDLDPEPLQWGREHNVAALSPAQQARVVLLQQDVLDASRPRVDVIAAQNFSFFTFHRRDQLRAYFARAHAQLDREGLLVLDLMGGPQLLREGHCETRRVAGFHYVWEQHCFNPITHRCRFSIHFRLRDGRWLRHAFRYDWRLWTVPEVRELLAEAGFTRSEVYWEGTARATGQGNGIYRRCEEAASDPAWVAYVVGLKASAAPSASRRRKPARSAAALRAR
ncbi:MAG: class I SAM-dependent methyltransferase [Proteobacteria bacterium]|nr:class I SAM-dependent methyltransferase [Pseudomonadota bacterium]